MENYRDRRRKLVLSKIGLNHRGILVKVEMCGCFLNVDCGIITAKAVIIRCAGH